MSSNIVSVVTAELVYADHALRSGFGLGIDADGVIQAAGPVETLPAVPVRRFARKALFPGFLNTHSHAFQRLIRGRTLTVPARERRADFWSWRSRMYEAALALEPDELEAVTAFCYLEMLRGGITAVAEFHYVHHDRDGSAYADRNTLSWRVIEASEKAGLRLALLPVAYHRGGFDRPADPSQRRFLSSDVDTFLSQVEALRTATTGRSRFRIGLAAHSVRAVPESWLGPLKAYARAHGMPAHVHANEQVAEVEQCLAATGKRPTELLDALEFLDADTTVVHATHLDAREKGILTRTGARVSVCPTTERDLGDGILDAAGLHGRGVPLCLGSDSQVQVDFFAEMRCLEGHERLRRRRRNVLLERAGDARASGGAEPEARGMSGRSGRRRAQESDGELSIAPVLWEAATGAGARSLRMPLGALAPGNAADAFTVSLDDFALEGAEAADIPGLLLCAGTPGSVRDVLVAGRVVLEDGHHP